MDERERTPDQRDGYDYEYEVENKLCRQGEGPNLGSPPTEFSADSESERFSEPREPEEDGVSTLHSIIRATPASSQQTIVTQDSPSPTPSELGSLSYQTGGTDDTGPSDSGLNVRVAPFTPIPKWCHSTKKIDI